jgi:hypothetical protein
LNSNNKTPEEKTKEGEWEEKSLSDEKSRDVFIDTQGLLGLAEANSTDLTASPPLRFTP